MIDSQGADAVGDLPESFAEQVKDALEHLYDLGYLQRHALVQEEHLVNERPTEITAQSLRRQLASAIEALNPGEGVSIHALRARVYNLLVLHYMQGMTVRETARELCISERHAYRGLREGEQLVAEVLWRRRSGAPSEASETAHRASLQQEMARLQTGTCPTELFGLLKSAQEVVETLAAQRQVDLRITAAQGSTVVSTSSMLGEQLLIAVLSQAVGQARPGAIDVSLTHNRQPSLILRYAPDAAALHMPAVNPLVVHLANQLGWAVHQEDHPTGDRVITLRMSTQQFAVLVIDDNEGLVELLERYLTDCPGQVIAAADGQAGLVLAQDEMPDVIVLDVMMPGMHGWEVLQRLQNHPLTSRIPVIVCSVITIPELAHALGAALFLAKPVSREQFLNALHQLGLV
jgi:CheY-like chemotaxis protein/transposase